MAYGFGTWDANGVDNNTGLVKINALGQVQMSGAGTGTYSFSLPSGYTLDFLVQSAGDFVSTARSKITVSGNSILVSSVSSNDYSANTYPIFTTYFILAYAR